LLRELGLDSGRVAIERNLEILPRRNGRKRWSLPAIVTKSCSFVGAASVTPRN